MALNPDELDDSILVCALRWEVDTWTAPQVRQVLARIRTIPASRHVIKEWQDLGRCWAERRRLDAFRMMAQALALDSSTATPNDIRTRPYVRHAVRAGQTAALRRDDPRWIQALGRSTFGGSNQDTIDVVVEAATMTPTPTATLDDLRQRLSPDRMAAVVKDLAMGDLDDAIRGVKALVPVTDQPSALLTVMREQAFHLPEGPSEDALVERLRPYLPVEIALASLQGAAPGSLALTLAEVWACCAPEDLARAWMDAYPGAMPRVRAHLRQLDLQQRPAPSSGSSRRRS